MKIKRILALTGASLIMASCLAAGASAMDQNFTKTATGGISTEIVEGVKGEHKKPEGNDDWWYGEEWGKVYSNYNNYHHNHQAGVRASNGHQIWDPSWRGPEIESRSVHNQIDPGDCDALVVSD